MVSVAGHPIPNITSAEQENCRKWTHLLILLDSRSALLTMEKLQVRDWEDDMDGVLLCFPTGWYGLSGLFHRIDG